MSAVASDATMLLLEWIRAGRGLLPPGASRDGLTMAFPGWRVVAEETYDAELRLLGCIDPRFVR